MIKKEEQLETKRLTELDETIILMTKPYAMATLTCMFLACFSLVRTWNYKDSPAFVISSITLGINIIFLVILYLRAKKIRKTQKE